MKIGIVGGGTVGHATARAFMEWGEVRVYDVLPERRTHDLDDVLDSEITFVCLPTPQSKGGLHSNTNAIDTFFGSLASMGDRVCSRSYVLRSTVPIGTTRRLREKYGLPNLVHSPEFLTARCAVTDAQIPARNIIGGTIGEAGMRLFELYERRFPGVPILRMSSDASEAVKLFLNSFFAVKVSLFNEFWATADALGIDWQDILRGILSDGRVAHSHTTVPGNDGKHGFGGACLPKDIANLISCMEAAGVRPDVCRAAYNRNETVDRVRVR